LNPLCVKSWEIIADNVKKAGWSWGCVSGLDCKERTIWIADTHRGDGKRFVVRAEEKLAAFMKLDWRFAADGKGRLVSSRSHCGPRRK